MPRLQQIQVRKGDYGTAYLNLSGYGDANNRILNVEHAKRLLRSWDSVKMSIVELVEIKGRLFIVNGQHRIYAASNFMNGAATSFQAVIHEQGELEARGIDLLEHIAHANAGKPQTINDLFTMYHQRSTWPYVFKHHGLAPETKQSMGTLTWANTVRSFLALKHSLKNKRVYAASSTIPREELLKAWLETPSEDIIRTAQLVQWWRPVAEAAKARKINALYSTNALYAAFLIHELNQGSPVLRDAPMRLLEWPELPNLKAWGRMGQGREMLRELLFAMNYKRTTYFLTVWGQTGREGRS